MFRLWLNIPRPTPRDEYQSIADWLGVTDELPDDMPF